VRSLEVFGFEIGIVGEDIGDGGITAEEFEGFFVCVLCGYGS
jgi:hypothetical protein